MSTHLNQILFVENDERQRRLFVEAAKNIHPAINCYWAKDVDAAEVLLSTHGNALPECIFIDFDTVKNDGVSWLRQIKKDQKLWNIPVIIITPSNDVKALTSLKSAGAVACIHKPSELNPMSQVLSFYLLRRNVAQLSYGV